MKIIMAKSKKVTLYGDFTMIMPSEVGAGQLLYSTEEQRISSYERFDEIVHQIYKEPGEAISLLDRLVGEMETSDPLHPLVERVRMVGQCILRGEAVDHLLFIYPGKLPGSFFMAKNSFEGNRPVLFSLEEEVINSPFSDYLEITVPILQEVLTCLEGHKPEPDFSFLALSDPNTVRHLFEVVDYLGLEEFQEKHLEPFNRKFPDIPLSQIPPTARSLCFDKKDRITAERFREIPSTIRKLDLGGVDVTGFDFGRLTGLEVLDLSHAKNVTAEQIGQLPPGLKSLMLEYVNVTGFGFGRLTWLEELDLSYAKNVTAEQIGQLPPGLKELYLLKTDVTGFDFGHLTGLEVLVLCFAKNVTAEQIRQLPPGFKSLCLVGVNVSDFGFGHLKELEELDLSCAENVTSEQIGQLPPGLKSLRLCGVDVSGFDFSHLLYTEISW